MGQRLVITCRYQNKDIAAIYYHYSAYTTSALYEALDLLDCVYFPILASVEDVQLMLIRSIEECGGCVDGSNNDRELNYVKSQYPNEEFSRTGSRNDGLIAISNEGILYLQDSADGTLIVDFDSKTINNECYYSMSLMEYVDEYLDGDDSDLYLPSINIDLNNIGFDDIDKVINTLHDVDSYMLPDEDCVIHLIG